jgi:hypothetical protein
LLFGKSRQVRNPARKNLILIGIGTWVDMISAVYVFLWSAVSKKKRKVRIYRPAFNRAREAFSGAIVVAAQPAK